MIPAASSLFGQTGYITEITSSERIGGAKGDGALPNTYDWHVVYVFKTNTGALQTGSMTATGDAVSAKSGLRPGSPVRYLAFAPRFNAPGSGGFDGNTLMYVGFIGLGVLLIVFGAKKEKPPKTPAQRSREYQAAKAPSPRRPQQQFQLAEPDWDSLAYDNATPVSTAEADELYGLATEEEVTEEFDLINAVDEGPQYYRRVLAIVRWRRANGL